MVRRHLLALATLLVLPLAAHAQERKPEAEAAKVLLDTPRARVTEVRVKPGAKFALKGHPYQFVYMLTDGSLVFSPPGLPSSTESLWTSPGPPRASSLLLSTN